ncbi:ADP-ribosylglycohydrolase family protein [Pseudonocardia broussonetiae]|nr:ADP-ribosylglycohydrolase family protein [Pseudonocardia broussonetiae]
MNRGAAALWGLAVGDALGMPTQSLPRALIVERHGPLVDGFHPGPPDHPLAAGLPAGTVTDDTEQAVLLGRLVVEGRGHVDAADLARRLVAWEDGMRARGSLDLLGPSTRRALAALAEGVPPEESGREGTTNGAAMRIAPVGLAVASDDLDALVDRVVEASALTHGTGVALAGAAAVAAAVSAGIDGAGFAEAVPVAVEAAGRAAARGRWVAAADVGERIAWAVAQVPPERIGTLVGTSLATQESVPAAFAVLAAAGGDPWLACRTAASLGGDTDTIAAMAGAVGGACGGEVPAEAVALVRRINDLDLDALAAALVALR